MGWNRKEQKRGAARFLTPVFLPTPTPPYLAGASFRPHMDNNLNVFNALYSSPVNQTVTKNP
jgi:hypothetical protein